MPCVKAPPVTPPSLPAGFGIPPLPSPPTPTVGLCCQLPTLPLPTPPIPLPPGTINIAFVRAVNTALSNVTTYVSQLHIPCPKE